MHFSAPPLRAAEQHRKSLAPPQIPSCHPPIWDMLFHDDDYDYNNYDDNTYKNAVILDTALIYDCAPLPLPTPLSEVNLSIMLFCVCGY